MPTGGPLMLAKKIKIFVSKPPILANLDEVLNGYTVPELEAACDALTKVNNRKKLGDLARARGLLNNPDGTVNAWYEAHLRNDWLNEDHGGYWPKHDGRLPIWMRLRRAILTVMAEMIASGLKNSTTWFAEGDEEHTDFHPVIEKGPRQITTSIHTAKVPRVTRLRGTRPRRNKNITVIAAGKTKPVKKHPLEYR